MTIDREVNAELKASLLSKGMRFDIDLFARYKGEFYDNKYVYGNTSAAGVQHRFPQVLLLGDGVITALLRRENTPWSLDFVADEVILSHDDGWSRPVGLPERPAYFGKRIADGTLAEDIIAVAGEDTPGFFMFPECYYFPEGNPCGFCSLRGARRTVAKNLVTNYTESNIAQAARLFQSTPWRPIPLISITTGTARTDEEIREEIIKPIRGLYDALAPKIPIHVLTHPPKDLSVIDEYKAAGVTTMAFNIEVFDRALFDQICPGKSRDYGYDNWMASVGHAQRVFGDYNVFCGLVWGLEPAESTMRGHREFLDKGWSLASNIFHADPKSVLRNHPQPSEEEIMRIARDQEQLNARYPDARTIFSVSMRSTLDWEIKRGDLTPSHD